MGINNNVKNIPLIIKITALVYTGQCYVWSKSSGAYLIIRKSK